MRACTKRPSSTRAQVAEGIASADANADADRERIQRACEEAIDHIPRELWPEMVDALKQHRALTLWLQGASALTKRP